MGRKEVCAVTKGITRIAILQDKAGRCYPKATGEISRELLKLMDTYQGVVVKPTWLLTQLAKTIKE